MPFKRLFGSEEKDQKKDPQIKDAPAQQSAPHIRSSRLADPDAAGNQKSEPLYENDNRASRILRLSHAAEFWRRQEQRRLKAPFLRYVFESELKAVDALLSLGCIYQAADTGHLICTAPIVLGCYRMLDGRYEVFLAGKALSYQIWSEAVQKFSDHHGRHRDQLKPETDVRYRSSAQQVVFEKEYYQLGIEGTHLYRVFKAPSLPAARSFLLQHENMVLVRDRSIMVEAPEGVLCRDMDGIHEMSRGEDPETE